MKLLTMKNCGICFKVKSLLEQKGIAFEMYTKDDPEGKRMLEECGVRMMPILEVNGMYYASTSALNYVKGL